MLTNAYSVPLNGPAVQVQAKVYASTVELWHNGQLRGPARTLLPSPAADSGSGTLPGCPASQAGAMAGSQAAGAAAASWVCGRHSFDRDLASTDRAAWEAGRNEADDRAAASWQPSTANPKLQGAIEFGARELIAIDAAAVRHLLHAERFAACRRVKPWMSGAWSATQRPLSLMHEDDQLTAVLEGGDEHSAMQLQEAIIKQQCKALRTPDDGLAVRALWPSSAMRREAKPHWLLGSVAAGRGRRTRAERPSTGASRKRICRAVKTLDEFDFSQSPKHHRGQELRRTCGRRLHRARGTGGCSLATAGTGKTHLLTGLCVAACRQKRRGRSPRRPALVNELVEAKHQLQLRRVLARWSRYDVIAIDEVGYVPLAEVGAEFLFQVMAERARERPRDLTTNLPFSEWTQVIPNARLCKALLDRITDRAHILETGAESYRFRRTAEKHTKGAKAS